MSEEVAVKKSWFHQIFVGPGGETSSKRISGVGMVVLGALMLVALGVYGFFAVPPGLEAIKYAGLSLIASGAALLGIGTLAERLGK